MVTFPPSTDSYATSCPESGRILNVPRRSLWLDLPSQWSIGAHGLDDLLNRRAAHLRVALAVQQRLVRRPIDYAVDAVGREGGQLLLHFEPIGRLLAGSDDRQRFVTQASCSAHLSAGFGGGAEFFNGGTQVLRRGVEGLDLLPLLRW